jgi:5-methylcytosine-specific restriction endonuclease McrA
MLFPYIYINHGVEKLHSYIEHLVVEVWCKAKQPFATGLLHKDFEPIVKSNNKFLLDPITEIHGYFLQLTDEQKKQIADGFQRNNDLEAVCNGTKSPMRFSDITAMNSDLSASMNDFFKNLYYSVLKISAVKKECGDLDEHYDAFMVLNKSGKCPFCGLSDLKSDLVSRRDAYDHYLPKDVYPFNSVNFKNLVPACNTCNSSYKLAKDPLFDKKSNKVRKTFYPFSNAKPDINFGVVINSLDSQDPKKNSIELSITSVTCQEEIDSWRDVYGADERYLDKCKSEDAKLWLQQICDDIRNYEHDPTIFFPKYINGRNQQPFYLEYNFIRIPFLQSCFVNGYVK